MQNQIARALIAKHGGRGGTFSWFWNDTSARIGEIIDEEIVAQYVFERMQLISVRCAFLCVFKILFNLSFA